MDERLVHNDTFVKMEREIPNKQSPPHNISIIIFAM